MSKLRLKTEKELPVFRRLPSNVETFRLLKNNKYDIEKFLNITKDEKFKPIIDITNFNKIKNLINGPLDFLYRDLGQYIIAFKELVDCFDKSILIREKGLYSPYIKKLKIDDVSEAISLVNTVIENVITIVDYIGNEVPFDAINFVMFYNYSTNKKILKTDYDRFLITYNDLMKNYGVSIYTLLIYYGSILALKLKKFWNYLLFITTEN